MTNYDDYEELVVEARQGDREALDRLAEVAQLRLREYVYRLTLHPDLTQDIVQETILEMFRAFGKLKTTERFWNWLCGIALNKVRRYYGSRWRRKSVSLSDAGHEFAAAAAVDKDGLADVVSRELKFIVATSIKQLQPRYRAVLTMRCYDQMSYAEIARLMGCSEIAARALFYRAKKALAGNLGRYGLGKGTLLTALVLFGKMTAASKAAAANVSVSAATLNVGAAATVLALATGKTAVVSLCAAAVVATTAVTVAPRLQHAAAIPPGDAAGRTTGTEGQYWYFFPEGPDGPVMLRVTHGQAGAESYCRYLQNQHANYHYDHGTVAITNARLYNPDLSVMRLPTDDPEMAGFISRVEGRPFDFGNVSKTRNGLLVISRPGAENARRILHVDHQPSALEEEFFQFDWPDSARIVDNRDPIHKQGWTYFAITGQINGQAVTGTGRMPFVYARAVDHYPWLKVKIAGRLTLIDSGREACLYDREGNTIAVYRPGAFFEGLARPWMGLHAIDTVRRDAARRRIWFQTRHDRDNNKAQVVLACDNLKLVYAIDLEGDLIEEIEFLEENEGDPDAKGMIRFAYLGEIAPTNREYAAPRQRGLGWTTRDRLGIFWLAELVRGRLAAGK